MSIRKQIVIHVLSALVSMVLVLGIAVGCSTIYKYNKGVAERNVITEAFVTNKAVYEPSPPIDYVVVTLLFLLLAIYINKLKSL